MAAAAGNGDRIYLKVGDAIRLYMPHTDTCMRWGVAGKPVYVAIIDEGSADLLHDDGTHFPMPILPGEAGIQTDANGHLWVPTRAVVSPQAGLGPLRPPDVHPGLR